MSDFPPPPNLHGNYAGSCVVCLKGTDTGLVFIGDAAFISAGLTALGIPKDQVVHTLAAATGGVDGAHPAGDMPMGVRVCKSCARRADLEVGLWPTVPLYIPPKPRS
ncbi:hypothetical protein [Amycolatopsis sp. CA-230715]|uniref:hypothetical protein n=1 Tax=Amycolatopsis sp. CA-230715 TaxID=2745196 RepID=UPI001C027621|nr:hypothetical protein [Amycolatopsis sp. CA-230715]QWF78675.1 hypothetical protein HUW46_02073 [Amycolatopsis sp. CA-230715]